MQTLSAEGVLGVLPKARIIELGRDLDVTLSASDAKERQIRALLRSGKLRFRELLRHLGRDELKSICRAHGLDDSGRARAALQSRILSARGGKDTAPPSPLFEAREVASHRPRAGDIVLCRHRQWLVEEVHRPEKEGQATRVRLVCLDDDAPGRVTDVLWELELGARVHKPEAHGLGEIRWIDPPRRFAAYLHALKWNTVTATDAELFQAPFRAGIEVQNYQLTPLMKALRLPRANLFIADDVGLGKTVEAGLVLSELMLRQRVDLTLIVCPAGVTLQWAREMRNKFGLNFQVMTRAFVANHRKQRGEGPNVWSSHRRFIISHQLLRRPEYRDPLLARLEGRARKSLLILDEAHVAAPAGGGIYATDSQITKVMRDIAPKFENRLFLSATPHNGHSNSFSALLELLDPHRFTRGVPVKKEDQDKLKQVMVRRLKQDLRDAGESGFPVRRLVKLGLRHEGGTWLLSERAWNPKKKGYSDLPERAIGQAPAFELELAEDLARYIELACPKKGRGRLSFVTLQKRLLSSVEAFAHTLQVHSQGKIAGKLSAAANNNARAQLSQAGTVDVELYGADDDSLEAERDEEVRSQSATLAEPSREAKALLEKMLKCAHKHRALPDAKVRALVDWIAKHQCKGVRLGARPSEPPRKSKNNASLKWDDRRLIIFTEYGDTRRYLLHQLSAAIAGTDQDEHRIMQLNGGMGEDQRDEVQRAFNAPPNEHPVRILIATDAAREGINLQGECADIIHFDVPWNPARLEQRNGRIDRKLQKQEVVRCHYFAYAQRREDPVLTKLVEKTDTIARELGSIASVVLDRIAERLETGGIRKDTPKAFEEWASGQVSQSAASELETTRARIAELKAENEEAGKHYNDSAERLEFKATLLKDALDEGFALAGAGPLAELAGTKRSPQYSVPAALGESWQTTLDTLRPVRERDEPFWKWRQKPLHPVTFKPVRDLSEKVVQLHLQHPLVQRVMSRFLAQGFSMGDLSRVTVVRNEHDALIRVIAFGRLSLFGGKAARLHDELVSVAARWVDTKPQPLKPFAEAGDAKALQMLEQILLESPELDDVPVAIRERVQAKAGDLFAQLWKFIREEADARGIDATKKLKARGRHESDALKNLLNNQHDAITQELRNKRQLSLKDQQAVDPEQTRREQQQWEEERKHMRKRLTELEDEMKTEPGEVQKLYEVALHRLQPVGLIVLWPATRMGGR